MCPTHAACFFMGKTDVLSKSSLNETFVSSYYLQISETSKGKAKVFTCFLTVFEI